jgi:hypothetical protein
MTNTEKARKVCGCGVCLEPHALDMARRRASVLQGLELLVWQEAGMTRRGAREGEC